MRGRRGTRDCNRVDQMHTIDYQFGRELCAWYQPQRKLISSIKQ